MLLEGSRPTGSLPPACSCLEKLSTRLPQKTYFQAPYHCALLHLFSKCILAFFTHMETDGIQISSLSEIKWKHYLLPQIIFLFIFIQNFYSRNFTPSSYVEELFFHITSTIISQIPIPRLHLTFTFIFWNKGTDCNRNLGKHCPYLTLLFLAKHHPGGQVVDKKPKFSFAVKVSEQI